MTDSEVDELVADLHSHVAATEELPVTPTANRWLGEAQAVAADAAGADLPPSTVAKRVEQVRMLLENVDDTGSEAADERVAAALETAAEIERRLG